MVVHCIVNSAIQPRAKNKECMVLRSALQGRLHAERATVNGNAVCAMCMHRNSDDMHQDLIQKKIVHAATTSELQ